MLIHTSIHPSFLHTHTLQSTDHHKVLIIMAGYQAVGIAGYAAFPRTVASNVLNTFPSEDPLMQVARLMIGIVVITHYPVNHHPARTSIEDLLRACFGWPAFRKPARYLQTTVFYVLSVVVAIFVRVFVVGGWGWFVVALRVGC